MTDTDLVAESVAAGTAEALRNNEDRHSHWRTGTVTSLVDPETAQRKVLVLVDGDDSANPTPMRTVNPVEVDQRVLVVFTDGGGVWCLGALGGKAPAPVGGFPPLPIGRTVFDPTGVCYDANIAADASGPLFGYFKTFYPYWTASYVEGAPSLTVGSPGYFLVPAAGAPAAPLVTITLRWFLRQNDGTLDGVAAVLNLPSNEPNPAAGVNADWTAYTDVKGAGTVLGLRGAAGSYAWTGRLSTGFGGGLRMELSTDGATGGHWRFGGGGYYTTRIEVVRYD